jgi:hypothetical protein
MILALLYWLPFFIVLSRGLYLRTKEAPVQSWTDFLWIIVLAMVPLINVIASCILLLHFHFSRKKK